MSVRDYYQATERHVATSVLHLSVRSSSCNQDVAVLSSLPAIDSSLRTARSSLPSLQWRLSVEKLTCTQSDSDNIFAAGGQSDITQAKDQQQLTA